MASSRSGWNRWTAAWFAQLIPLAPVVAYVLVRLVLGPRLGTVTGAIGLVAIAYTLMVVLLGTTGRGPRWLAAHRLQLALGTFAALFTYVLCEVALSGLHAAGLFARGDTQFWIYENSQNTIHFDPIRGYRLTQTPARFARLTNGEVEYVGTLKGNNEGFPDRDDFSPARPANNARRLAVFGDSYSAAQFIEENWPDKVEDLTRDTDHPLQLLNFSVDGGGLANWWSVLLQIVKAQDYDIDGVIFAVYPGDLRRGFSLAEHRGYDRHMFGRMQDWNPDAFPRTGEQAAKFLQPLDGYIVTTDDFDAALRGEWKPTKNVSPLRRLFLTSRVYDLAADLARRANPGRVGTGPDEADELGEGPTHLIEQIKSALYSLGVSALVVSVPSRDALLHDGDRIEVDPQTRKFASLIGADLVNGGLAFQGLSPAQIQADWLPHDRHWGQGGSDRFARYMAEILAKWPPRDQPPEKP